MELSLKLVPFCSFQFRDMSHVNNLVGWYGTNPFCRVLVWTVC